MLPYARRNWWYMVNHLSTHPCVDCGETNPEVLEFDHIQPKLMGIPQAVYKMGFDRFKAEIEKCEVRCANDHKKRHYRAGI